MTILVFVFLFMAGAYGVACGLSDRVFDASMKRQLVQGFERSRRIGLAPRGSWTQDERKHLRIMRGTTLAGGVLTLVLWVGWAIAALGRGSL